MKVGEKKLQIGNRCLTIKTKKIMKKNLFMVAAVALIATVSCNKEEFRNNDAQGVASDVVFVAELEQPGDDVEVAAPAAAQTKTALGSTTNGVTAVNWVGNEKVSINGVEFTTTSTGAKATFTTTKTFDKTAAKFDAIYPASAGTALTAVTIPASQKGTFAEAAISVATSTTTSLNFKNLASIIKFQVPSACSTITITSTANLAGKVAVTFGSNGLPTIGTVSSASKTITLTGSFTTGKDYYVAVLPGSHKFTVRLDGYLSKASTTAVTTKRAVITNLKTFPKPEASNYKIMGVGGDWTTGKVFYKDVDCYLIKNVSLTATTEFKFCQEISSTNKVWGRPITLAVGKWAFTYDVDGNLKTTAGSYDIYVSAANDAVCFVKSGTAMPEYKNGNKLIHVLYEGKENCGLYIQSPSTTENGYNNSGAWGNFTHVYMKKTSSASQDYCAFPLPSNAVGVSCKFTIRVWGDKNKTYTMTLTDDTPFWGNSDNGGSYSLSSKIDIK